MDGNRLTFLLRPSRGRSGVEALATPTATELDSASDMEDESRLTPVSEEVEEERGSVRRTEGIDIETDLEIEMALPEETSRRVPMHYRWTRSLLTDMKKPVVAYDVDLGRDQSLWSYVFS